MRYFPYANYTPPEPRLLFDILSTLRGIDILRRSFRASFATIVQAQVPRREEGGWCNSQNACPEHSRGYNGIEFMNVTFEMKIPDKDAMKQITVIIVKEDHSQSKSKLLRQLEIGKMNDVFIINQGLHYMNQGGKTTKTLLSELQSITPAIIGVLNKNVSIIWREISAVYFNTSDGYWKNYIRPFQSNQSAVCVSSAAINATVSYANANEIIVPYMESIGIPILKT